VVMRVLFSVEPARSLQTEDEFISAPVLPAWSRIYRVATAYGHVRTCSATFAVAAVNTLRYPLPRRDRGATTRAGLFPRSDSTE